MTGELEKRIRQVFVLMTVLIAVMYQAIKCPVYIGENMETAVSSSLAVMDYSEWSSRRWMHPLLRFTLCGLPDENKKENHDKWYYRLDLLTSGDGKEIVFTDYFEFSGPVERLVFQEDFNFDGYPDIGIWENKEDSGDTSVFLVWDDRNGSFTKYTGGMGGYSINRKEEAIYFRAQDMAGIDVNEVWQWFGNEFRRTGAVVRTENKAYATVDYQVIEYRDGKPDAGKVLWNTRYEDETADGEQEKILKRIRMFEDKIAGKYKDNQLGYGKALLGSQKDLLTVE